MKETQQHLEVVRTARQKEAWEAFFDPEVRELLYGGAKGGGKSYLLCVLMYTLSMALIEIHGLKASSKPLHWAWMGRKVGSDFVGTTLDTWQRIIPSDCYRICGASDIHPRHILIWDRIAIDFGGLDSQQAINKFNSAEYAVIAVDQAEETVKDDVAVLMGSRRLKIKGKDWLTYTPDVCKIFGVTYRKEIVKKWEKENAKDIKSGKINGIMPMPFKGIWTANPAQCWLKNDFLDDPKPSYRFVRALPSDNPHLPEDYASVTLLAAFGHQPELLRAYLDGDWEVMAGAQQIIDPKWLMWCRQELPNTDQIKHVACDTARYGDDSTIIGAFEGKSLLEVTPYPRTSVTLVADAIISTCRKVDAYHATIESTGADLGAGAIDIIKVNAPDIKITTYVPQGASTATVLGPDGKPRKIYGNMRAEAWSYTAKQLSEHSCYIPAAIDQTLTNQLCWPKYSFKLGKTYVETKDEIKDRFQKSPDWADMYVMGIWGSQFVEAAHISNTVTKSFWRSLKRQYA